MIQKSPFPTSPDQFESTSSPVSEVPSDGESDALKVAETTGTVLGRKSKLSEDEIRLGEEAFLNALVELEALGNTAADLTNERAEKDRQARSKIDDLRRIQEQGTREADNWSFSTPEQFEGQHIQVVEQGTEEAHNWGFSSPEQLEEQQTQGVGQGAEEAHNWNFSNPEPLEEEQAQSLSAEPSQGVEEEDEPAPGEAHPHGDDSSPPTFLGESFTSQTDFSDFLSEKPFTEGELQRDDLALVATLPVADTKISTSSDESDLPADVIRGIHSDSSSEFCAALSDLARLGGENAFRIISLAFDEQSEDVRNAAAHALFDLQPDRVASFARTLREASPERRRRIGSALATSGLADIAIGNLAGQSREQGYEAFSLMFLMTKAGEAQPLLRALEDHSSIEARLTVVKLLALNGQTAILPSLRRLAVSGVLPSEVRAAVIEAIYELGRQIPRQLSLGAKVIENQINL